MIQREVIPKKFYRIWIGGNPLPNMFELWWDRFQQIHPDYEFQTIKKISDLEVPKEYSDVLELCYRTPTCAGASDIMRLLLMYLEGGIYIDTDVMPLQSFNAILDKDNERPFLGKRSTKSFEIAVIGSPKGHKGFRKCLRRLPEWWEEHKGRSAAIQTGPAFFSKMLFGREDVQHLPSKTFYPYNGFRAPKREEKLQLFLKEKIFPQEMIAAHFSNHRWGGKLKTRKKAA